MASSMIRQALFLRIVAVGVVLAAGSAASAAEHKSEVVSISTRPGITQEFILVQPNIEPPAAAVILFTGSGGALNLDSQGAGTRNRNFLVRNRDRFADAGFLVAVPDTPSDYHSGYGKIFRGSDEHGTDIADVIAYLRAHTKAPVWLVGTSMGTLSATKGGLLLTGGPDGVVLTSSITRHTHETVMTVLDFSLQKIRLPTLIVANREDACGSTPADGAKEIAARLTAAPKVEVKMFEGGSTPQGDPCEAMARHGYIGLDPEVVAAIADWIKATPPH
jgi:pimeloyl-ACP methyl ester carboxylesterase